MKISWNTLLLSTFEKRRKIKNTTVTSAWSPLTHCLQNGKCEAIAIDYYSKRNIWRLCLIKQIGYGAFVFRIIEKKWSNKHTNHSQVSKRFSLKSKNHTGPIRKQCMTANSCFMILRLCSIQWFSNRGMKISSDGIYYVSPSERDLNIEKASAAYYLSLAIKAVIFTSPSFWKASTLEWILRAKSMAMEAQSERCLSPIYSPPVIITPDNSSYPTKLRAKKIHSRTSLATDRFSCISFLTTSHRSDYSVWIPRWRSLPCNLEEEIFYDDCPEFLKAWSRYRITNMTRRYKTMDYIHMVLDDTSREIYTEIDGCCGGDLSASVGLSVSRDLLNSPADFTETGSGIVPRSASDENIQYYDQEFDKQWNLTQMNLSYAFPSSRSCSSENLNAEQKTFNRIEKWLRKCNSGTNRQWNYWSAMFWWEK